MSAPAPPSAGGRGPLLLMLASASCIGVVVGIPAGMLFPPFFLMLAASLACGLVAAVMAREDRRAIAAGERTAADASYINAAYVMGIIGAGASAPALVLAIACGMSVDLARGVQAFWRASQG